VKMRRLLKPVQFIPYVPLLDTFSPIVITDIVTATSTALFNRHKWPYMLLLKYRVAQNFVCSSMEFIVIVINRKALTYFLVPALWLLVRIKFYELCTLKVCGLSRFNVGDIIIKHVLASQSDTDLLRERVS
jgi:hypothetical protein